MAVADFFSTAVDKVRELYNGFFYDGAEAPAPRRRDKKQSQREAQQPQVQQPYPYNQPQQQYMGYQPPYQQQEEAPDAMPGLPIACPNHAGGLTA